MIIPSLEQDMKTCIKCNQQKPLNSFYKAKGNADGIENSCKECVKEYKRLYRQINADKLRERDRTRYLNPKRQQWIKDYSLSERGKKARNTANRASSKKYQHAKASRLLTWFLIKNGLLKKETECSECKSTVNVQAHHDDYTKPTKIRWLCIKCHSSWHRKNKPIYGEIDDFANYTI